MKRAESKQYSKQYRAARKARGACVQCGARPQKPGASRCDVCCADNVRRVTFKRRLAIAAGLCGQCMRAPKTDTTYCISCRGKKIGRSHGLTEGEYARVCELVPHCQACAVVLTHGREPTGRCIDHNHKTGVRRGVLCSACNKALGHAQESSDRLRALADYIERVSK